MYATPVLKPELPWPLLVRCRSNASASSSTSTAPAASAMSKICPICFSVSPNHLLSTLERSNLTKGRSRAVARASAVMDLPVPGKPDNNRRYPICRSVKPGRVGNTLRR